MKEGEHMDIHKTKLDILFLFILIITPLMINFHFKECLCIFIIPCIFKK